MTDNEKIWYAPNRFQSYGDKEIMAVTECLKDGWLAGFGPKSKEFEERVSHSFGKEYGLFVNSGSSANLLALLSLNLKKGFEVITPACTFATTVAPIIQTELKPVFCDVNLTRFVPDVEQVVSKINEKTRVIMIPNLIGNKPDWKGLRDYITEHKLNIVLIEDSCDTMTYTKETDISTTSFYASHLITAAGSGGMVMFNDGKQLKRATMYRDWGRIGDNSENVEDRFNYSIDGIPYDWKFLYGVCGYNFKCSEINAAFGLVQFEKMETFKSIRRELFERYLNNLRDCDLVILADDENKADWLAIPFIIKKGEDRANFLKYLEKNQIQTRVCFSGNILRHPAYKKYETKERFPNSDSIMESGFLLGCHHGMTITQVDYICKLIKEYKS